MSRATLILRGKTSRQLAASWAFKAPDGTTVEFRERKRSVPQNDRMHAMLTDVARQARHHGFRLTKDEWKLLFLDALKRDLRLVPNLAGDGVLALSGRSSSELTVSEMSDMIELIFKYGAEHGVTFHDADQGASGAKNSVREVA